MQHQLGRRLSIRIGRRIYFWIGKDNMWSEAAGIEGRGPLQACFGQLCDFEQKEIEWHTRKKEAWPNTHWKRPLCSWWLDVRLIAGALSCHGQSCQRQLERRKKQTEGTALHPRERPGPGLREEGRREKRSRKKGIPDSSEGANTSSQKYQLNSRSLFFVPSPLRESVAETAAPSNVHVLFSFR
jgi:hypothetical protein